MASDAGSDAAAPATGGRRQIRPPSGGLFDLVACPNYLGECIEWCGFTILANGARSTTAFAFWTFANLFPRAPPRALVPPTARRRVPASPSRDDSIHRVIDRPHRVYNSNSSRSHRSRVVSRRPRRRARPRASPNPVPRACDPILVVLARAVVTRARVASERDTRRRHERTRGDDTVRGDSVARARRGTEKSGRRSGSAAARSATRERAVRANAARRGVEGRWTEWDIARVAASRRARANRARTVMRSSADKPLDHGGTSSSRRESRRCKC